MLNVLTIYIVLLSLEQFLIVYDIVVHYVSGFAFYKNIHSILCYTFQINKMHLHSHCQFYYSLINNKQQYL